MNEIMNDEAYQIEVKHALLEKHFKPQDGWMVAVSIDGMEKGKSNQPEKRKLAERCLERLQPFVKPHPKFRGADFVAEGNGELWLIEVEGQASKQIEQRFYSALGQLLSHSKELPTSDVRLALAFPDTVKWRDTVKKRLPLWLKDRLRIEVFHLRSHVRE